MESHAERARIGLGKDLFAAGESVIAAAIFLTALMPPGAHSAPGQAPATQSPTQSSSSQQPAVQTSAPQSSKIPDWQIAAGGKMEFEVASVKQDTAAPNMQTVHSNILLNSQDLFSSTGGLLKATNLPLLVYIAFGYKLTLIQIWGMQVQLPKWANANRYDIEARAPGNPTKDQFRLMVQALLADRFKLAVHFETRQLPVMALVPVQPGKLGPQLQLHPENSPCSTAAPTTPGLAGTVAGGFPDVCGAIVNVQRSTAGRVRFGGRNIPVQMFADTFQYSQLPGTQAGARGSDRPVLDRTGITGKIDFIMEMTPEITGPLPPGMTFQPDESGPTMLQALKEQLGLKLEPQTGPVDVIVIDHVEEPSAN